MHELLVYMVSEGKDQIFVTDSTCTRFTLFLLFERKLNFRDRFAKHTFFLSRYALVFVG